MEPCCVCPQTGINSRYLCLEDRAQLRQSGNRQSPPHPPTQPSPPGGEDGALGAEPENSSSRLSGFFIWGESGECSLPSFPGQWVAVGGVAGRPIGSPASLPHCPGFPEGLGSFPSTGHHNHPHTLSIQRPWLSCFPPGSCKAQVR